MLALLSCEIVHLQCQAQELMGGGVVLDLPLEESQQIASMF